MMTPTAPSQGVEHGHFYTGLGAGGNTSPDTVMSMNMNMNMPNNIIRKEDAFELPSPTCIAVDPSTMSANPSSKPGHGRNHSHSRNRASIDAASSDFLSSLHSSMDQPQQQAQLQPKAQQSQPSQPQRRFFQSNTPTVDSAASVPTNHDKPPTHSRRKPPSNNHRRRQSLPAASALLSVHDAGTSPETLTLPTSGIDASPNTTVAGNTQNATSSNSAGRPPVSRRRFFQEPVSKSAPPASAPPVVTEQPTASKLPESKVTPLPKSGIKPKNRHRRIHSLPMVFEVANELENEIEDEPEKENVIILKHAGKCAPSNSSSVRKLDEIASFAAAAANLEEYLSPVKTPRTTQDQEHTGLAHLQLPETDSSAGNLVSGAGSGPPPKAHLHRRYFSAGGNPSLSQQNPQSQSQNPIMVYNAPAEDSKSDATAAAAMLSNVPMESEQAKPADSSRSHMRHASLPAINQGQAKDKDTMMCPERQERRERRARDHSRHRSSGSFGGSASGKQVLMLNSVLANPEALRLNQKLLKTVTKLGENHFQVSSLLNQMGSLLFASSGGHFADAAYFYKRSLKVIRHLQTHDLEASNCDEQHYELSKLEASTCTNLGTTQWRLQAFQDALVNFTRAYQVHHAHAAHHDTEDASAATKASSDAAHNLGCALTFAKDYDAAVVLLEETLRLRIQFYGRQHIEVARTVSLLGTVYGHKLEYKQALMWHMEALEMKQKMLAPVSPQGGFIHPSIIASMKDVAKCNEALGQLPAALQFYMQLESEQCRTTVSTGMASPQQSAEHGKLLHSIGTLYHKLQFVPQAQGSFQEARLLFIKAGLTQNDPRVQALKQSMLALVQQPQTRTQPHQATSRTSRKSSQRAAR